MIRVSGVVLFAGGVVGEARLGSVDELAEVCSPALGWQEQGIGLWMRSAADDEQEQQQEDAHRDHTTHTAGTGFL